MKKLMTILLASLLLVGCAGKEKTAKEYGGGISVEIAASQKIKHVGLVKYVGGIAGTSDNVINADNSPFKKGQILWFDTPLSEGDSIIKIEVTYSLNTNETEEKTTEKIDISKANKWVNLRLNQDMELEIVDME